MTSYSNRLNAIADALETASRQVRLLAEEIPAPMSAQEMIDEINRISNEAEGSRLTTKGSGIMGSVIPAGVIN